MMFQKLVIIPLTLNIACSYSAGQLECRDQINLSQPTDEELAPLQRDCIDFVFSRFTTIGEDEPEFNELVQLCACNLFKKGFKDSDKESFWNSLEEDLFSESAHGNQSIEQLNEDELESYFENFIESQEEVEEDEEDLESSGFRDLEREDQLVDSIQMGISQSLADLLSKPIKSLNFQDFSSAEKKYLTLPPSDRYRTSKFQFKTYAPVAFYHLHKLYGIRSIDFFHSIGIPDNKLTRFGNPGASGSRFFCTNDDKFFIKTAQTNEARLMISILKSYYKNFEINPRSLLPKFVGQYTYYGENLRKVDLLAMNNLLPSYVKMNYKYDLKGSTYNRIASAKEQARSSPTFKDQDFINQNAKGFTVEPGIYDALMATLKKDVKFLKTINSMDYSLLLGVHKVESVNDVAIAEKAILESSNTTNRFGPIEAVDGNGQKVLLYMGIIDILQDYRITKKVESFWKTLFQGKNISVKHPAFYAQRFYNFISKIVLRRG